MPSFLIKTDSTAKMYESLLIALFLAFSGGLLDVYTYISRGGVFAFAQTGNMLLMAIKFAEGQWQEGLYYLIPITSFTIGVFFTEYLQMHLDNNKFVNYSNIVIGIEIITLVVIAFLPASVPNNIVCIIVSFVCAMQTNCFRKLAGSPYATTMCTGNLRTASEYLFRYFAKRDKEDLRKSIRLFIVIVVFIFGAIVGTLCTVNIGKYATIVCAIILICALVLIIYEQRKIQHRK